MVSEYMRLFISLCLLSHSAIAFDPLNDAISTASSAMRAQSARLRVAAENLANEDSIASTPGGKPYQRKTIIFHSKKDPKTGINMVTTTYGVDNKTDFKKIYSPNHPGADAEGYLLMPNVEKAIENADIKEASRGYEANLGVIEITRSMANKTLEVLR